MHALTPLLSTLISLTAPDGASPSTSPPAETILVLDLDHSADVSADVAKTVTQLLVVAVGKSTAHRVLSGADLQSLTALEGERQALGCVDSSCLVEVANALGARYVVSGRLSTLGTEFVLQVSLLDADKAVPIGREQTRQASVGLLADAVPSVVSHLLAGLHPDRTADGGESSSLVVENANTTVDDSSGETMGNPALMWLMILGGSTAAVVGVLFAAVPGVLAAQALNTVVNAPESARNRDAARVAFFTFTGVAIVGSLVAAAGTATAIGGIFVE